MSSVASSGTWTKTPPRRKAVLRAVKGCFSTLRVAGEVLLHDVRVLVGGGQKVENLDVAGVAERGELRVEHAVDDDHLRGRLLPQIRIPSTIAAASPGCSTGENARPVTARCFVYRHASCLGVRHPLLLKRPQGRLSQITVANPAPARSFANAAKASR